MKIFNWVQRRFHSGALKDGLARNVKKAESITNEADKQALLKQVALVDVLDGWKDGILTIGTLGLDPLKPFSQPYEYEVLESEDEDEEFEEDQEQGQYTEEDENDEDEDDDVNNNNVIENEEEVNPLLFTLFEANVVKSNEVDVAGLVGAGEISSCGGENDRRRRITLGELFLADSDMKKKLDFEETEVDPGKKKADVHSKSGKYFAKKFIPEDSRPMKKIQQLMRRMLKRKIHPELEGKSFKAESHNKVATDEEKATESVSLLRITSGAAL